LSLPSILHPDYNEATESVGEGATYLRRISKRSQVELEIVQITLGLSSSAKSVNAFECPII